MVGKLASMNNDVANVAYSYDSAGRLNEMAEAFNTPSGTPLPGTHGVQHLFRPEGGLLQTTVSSPTLSNTNHVFTYYLEGNHRHLLEPPARDFAVAGRRKGRQDRAAQSHG